MLKYQADIKEAGVAYSTHCSFVYWINILDGLVAAFQCAVFVVLSLYYT